LNETGREINCKERFSILVSTGALVLISSGHSCTAFLQQVGLDFFGGVLKANRLAINTSDRIPKLIRCFFCMVMVLGFEERNSEYVTVNLKIVWLKGKPILDEQPERGYGLAKSADKLFSPAAAQTV